MKDFISVIVPTLNEEKYIKRTLLALKHQDYEKKFEIIVVDSESKDKTVSIARNFADKVVRMKKRGVGRARNVGANVAKGNILIFIDGDTIPMPNLISKFGNSFKTKNVVCATCPILPLEYNSKNSLLYAVYNLNTVLSLKTKKPQIAGICVGYRRGAFLKAGGFDETTHALEDFILSEKISKFGKVVFDENTAVFTSTRRFQKWGIVKSMKNYLKFYLQHLINGKKFRRSDYEVIR